MLSVNVPVVYRNEIKVTVYISSLRGAVNWQTKDDNIKRNCV
jgi:hypothetical protein